MCILVIPLIALIPDITYNMFTKVFYPTPTDWVMLQQSREPEYEFTQLDQFTSPLPGTTFVDKHDNLVKHGVH